jgi:allophanate hydrolase
MSLRSALTDIYNKIEAGPLAPVWISLVPRDQALERANRIEQTNLPLRGMTFAVKDNIDVAGLPTTAACPAFEYRPEATAPVVQALESAGAILIGKTNMDQFATGLVGTRSPHGACSSIYNDQYISGGSSSGSAVAVAKELVTFSLGTDTAGSGRVPAAFNNLIGLKPTRGLLSASGVVPACRTLDCVSIFARTVAEASAVFRVASKFDPSDPFSRIAAPGQDAAPWLNTRFRFGVPATDRREFFGDEEAADLYRAAIAGFEQLGFSKVEIDFSVFREAADLLYSGPWVAERLAAIEDFARDHAAEMHPVVRGIITGAARYSAVDAFKAQYKLQELIRRAAAEWVKMDVLLLPTTGTIYTIDQVNADPVKLNTNLGYYTNFVNLMDLAAIAVPAGFRTNGLPFGISIIGPAFTDEALLTVAQASACGGLQSAPGCVTIAVVGAHLNGQPLNWQLTDRGARYLETRRTAPNYRLHAIAGTAPAKPGLERDDTFEGPGIEVELWSCPVNQFGSFVAAIPPPLGIGTVTLDDKSEVKCFIAEPHALRSAEEITRFGGWRSYLSSRK